MKGMVNVENQKNLYFVFQRSQHVQQACQLQLLCESHPRCKTRNVKTVGFSLSFRWSSHRCPNPLDILKFLFFQPQMEEVFIFFRIKVRQSVGKGRERCLG